jgi:hypothetical protein
MTVINLQLCGVTFTNCILEDVMFCNVVFYSVHFRNIDFRKVRFLKIHLDRAAFEHPELTRVCATRGAFCERHFKDWQDVGFAVDSLSLSIHRHIEYKEEFTPKVEPVPWHVAPTVRIRQVCLESSSFSVNLLDLPEPALSTLFSFWFDCDDTFIVPDALRADDPRGKTKTCYEGIQDRGALHIQY